MFSNTHFCLESGFLSFLELQKSLLVSFQKGHWTQWQRFESSSIHCFWDTLQHVLKHTFLHRKWPYLSFLELQKSLLVSFQMCWTQWQRFGRSSIHCFWDTPQHFLKTHFCLETGFLSFLELQKSLLVTFQGCWTQWQRCESSNIHHFWDTLQHVLKTHFCLETGFLSFLELQKSLLVSFQGCWTQWQRCESSSIHCFWDTPQHFLKIQFVLRKWLSFIPRAPEIPTSEFSGVLNTMAKVWKL